MLIVIKYKKTITVHITKTILFVQIIVGAVSPTTTLEVGSNLVYDVV